MPHDPQHGVDRCSDVGQLSDFAAHMSASSRKSESGFRYFADDEPNSGLLGLPLGLPRCVRGTEPREERWWAGESKDSPARSVADPGKRPGLA